MIFDTEILRFEITYFFNLAYAWCGKFLSRVDMKNQGILIVGEGSVQSTSEH